jgi:hypothetical protein
MRPAPAVTVPLRHFVAWHAWVAFAAAAGLVSLSFAWALTLGTSPYGRMPDLYLSGGVAAGGVAVAVASVVLWQRGVTTLGWDGQQWSVDAQPLISAPEVMLDAGGVLLLRLRTAEGVRWLPVTRQGGADLHALRCALMAGAAPGSVQPLSL